MPLEGLPDLGRDVFDSNRRRCCLSKRVQVSVLCYVVMGDGGGEALFISVIISVYTIIIQERSPIPGLPRSRGSTQSGGKGGKKKKNIITIKRVTETDLRSK